MSKSTTPHFDIMVIGAGPAGMSAARFARSRDKSLRIGTIRTQQHSIIPCSQPYSLDGTVKLEDTIKSDKAMLEDANIELCVGMVEAIDADAHTLTVSGCNNEQSTYDRLVVATGARPVVPPIPGTDLPGVHVFHDMPDARDVLAAMPHTRTAVVVGGGYIGLEVATAFIESGLNTHLVEMLPVCLGNVCSTRFARMALEQLHEHGIKTHLGHAVAAVLGDERAEGVRVGDETIDADMVVFAVGVRTNTDLLAAAGAQIGRFGVEVDDRMQTSLADVWAAGDCIQHRNFITGAPGNGPLATNALTQAKTAAINMTGGFRTFPGFINASATWLFGTGYGSTGLNVEKATAAGITTVVGCADALTCEYGFPGASPLTMELVFDAATTRLIGAETVGAAGVPERVDMLALAIQHRLTMEDLATMHYSNHPPQTDVPAKRLTINAAEDALRTAGLL